MSQKKLSSFFKTIQKTSPTCKRKIDPNTTASENESPAAKAPKLGDEISLAELDGNVDSDSAYNSEDTKGSSWSTLSSQDASNKLSQPENVERSSIFQPSHESVIAEIAQLADEFAVVDKKMGPSWYKALKSEFRKPYFAKLSKFVTEERSKAEIYPPPDKVWSWTKECSLDNIKVVILGQDPYHNPGQAHGLCFSVLPPVPPPPSLVNMYKELTTDIEGFTTPNHGYLVGWARQGVLLLNACLTVRKNMANSHKDQGWEQLTSSVIKYLNDHKTGLVFMLWGAYAQKKAEFVDKKKHCVLKTVHPSPLSASRGWFGSKHFSKCNEYLKSVGKRPIDWNRLPAK
ncbi:Uracil-DNA glycosylase [Nesidiocoris tenuis]|uniref:Uracil-DNA glycosylase n=1 Tax=Nesidiocoris tenuis TaxID=355587 RepID=A0ABN7AWV2_9HEMI|nr:Uracil-DNA glycosylase [Nesidiocoris tenuis]